MPNFFRNFLIIFVFLLFSGAVFGQPHKSNVKASLNPAIVVVANYDGTGMGWVVRRNLVITAGHVVTDTATRKVIRFTTVYFGPDFERKSLVGRTVSLDRSRDLALISVNTGAITPIDLADNAPVGQTVYWNLFVSDTDYTKFREVSGVIAMKENYYHLNNYWPRFVINYHERVRAPEDAGLLLVVNNTTEPGSSGGPGIDSNNKAVGLVTMRDIGNISRMISVDAIRRFLEEYRQHHQRTRNFMGH